MSNRKTVVADHLDSDLTKVADAIRAKTGTTEDLDFPSGFIDKLDNMQDFLVQRAMAKLTEYSSDAITGAMGTNAFANIPTLVSISLPNWTSGGAYAFQGCAALANVNCPGVKAIGEYCFANCKALARIELPSLTYLSSYAFTGCTALATVIIDKATVPTLQNVNAFNNTPIANGTGRIYVPSNMVDSFKAASGWSTYANQIVAITGNE